MVKIVKNLMEGVKQALVLDPSEDYIYPSKSGFREDAQALRGDVKKVTQDMYKTTRNYGKQI